MAPTDTTFHRSARLGRMLWTLVSLVLVQLAVCGLSMFPVVVTWQVLLDHLPASMPLRALAVSMAIAPSYVVFALCLLVVSPAATGLLGWRSPADVQVRIANMEWPLLAWVR